MRIDLRGEICELEDVIQQVKAAEEDVEFVINSPGGDVIEAFNLVRAIQNCPHDVTANVEVMAASAAAIIALACDKFVMTKNDILMLHNCWTVAVGNAKEVQQEVEAMNAIDTVIHNIVADKCKDPDALIARMDAGDVWLVGEEAVELFEHGEVIEAMKDQYAAAGSLADLIKDYNKVKAELDDLKNAITKKEEDEEEKAPDPEPSEGDGDGDGEPTASDSLKGEDAPEDPDEDGGEAEPEPAEDPEEEKKKARLQALLDIRLE